MIMDAATSLLTVSFHDVLLPCTVATVSDFLPCCCYQIGWCTNMSSAMTSGQLAKGVLEADEMLAIHQERKAEIDGRYSHYNELKVSAEP